MSIRTRLLTLFALLATVGIAAFLILWVYGLPALGVDGMYGYEYRRAIVSVEAAADKQRDLVEAWFEERRREQRLLAADEGLARALEAAQRSNVAKAELVRRLKLVAESSTGSYRAIRILKPSSVEVVASTTDESPPPKDLQSWVHEAMEPGMTESVRLFSDDGGPHIAIIWQIAKVDSNGMPDGTLLGLLVAELEIDAPFQRSDTTMRQALGDTGAVMLVNRSADVLLQHASALGSHDLREVAGAVVSGTEGVRLITTAQNTEVIAVFRYLHLGASDELSIAVSKGTDEAMGMVRTSFIRMSGLMGVIFVLAMGLVIFAATRIAHAEAEVRALNTSLEQRIDERTHELAQTNDNLKSTLNNLAQTRDELVRSEKLAALGSLVAGVAHELNTPLGNSLTVASTMMDHSRVFQQALAEGLKRSALDAYVKSTQEGSTILLASLQKANDLVSSFKQVAVDQTSVNLRRFKLRETIDDILMTLGPTLRKTSQKVVIDIDEGISMVSFPGPLGQIVTNLVNNALVHGLPGRQGGVITLWARQLGDLEVELRVSDNGTGIAPAHLNKVFDPFFTTKLGQGGSGLGLNIVYNLVTKSLQGSVRVESIPGQGTTFTLLLPLSVKAPLQGDGDSTDEYS